MLRVIDHKTGKRATKQAVGIGGGSTLQPALYAVAAETLLGKSVESGRLEYCTQRGGYTATEIKVDNNTRQYLNHALDIIQNSIESAFLPAAPQPGACSLCDYRLVCGPHEELRVKKWKPPVEALDDLRRLP